MTAIKFPGDDAVLAHLAETTSQHFNKRRERGSRTAAPPHASSWMRSFEHALPRVLNRKRDAGLSSLSSSMKRPSSPTIASGTDLNWLPRCSLASLRPWTHCDHTCA